MSKKQRKNKPNHQPRHQFLTTSASPPAPNQQGLANFPDLPMSSSPTLPSEWAGGGSALRSNPPAHPLWWARGVLDLACPSIQTFLTALRVTLRGLPSRRLVIQLFFCLPFSSQNDYFLTSPGTQKSTQNRLLGQKLAPQVDFLGMFQPFLFFLCAESPSGSIFGGCDPSKLCSRHNGSPILTKSPFSEKRRK